MIPHQPVQHRRELLPPLWRFAIRLELRFKVRLGILERDLGEAGVMPFRLTPVSGAPGGPFCMMGACFDCLIEIEGTTRQACMVDVATGLEITLPKGRRDG